MDTAQQDAIAKNIAIEMNGATTALTKFIVSHRSSATNSGLVFHQALAHLKDELVPALEERLIGYCLDVGVLDVDFIAAQISSAFLSRIPAMGRSFGASVGGANVGAVMRTAMEFENFAKGRCAALPGRVQVAVEKRKRAALPAPGVVIHSVTGAQVQIGNGNSQTTTVNITLQELVQQLAASKDEEAKGLVGR